jgi:hypothetical protein
MRDTGKKVAGDGIIPRHEPELVESTARKHYRGDDEKVATTTVDLLIVDGIRITSRYRKADELEVMLALPSALCRQIHSMYCDSKVSKCFLVVLRHWDKFSAYTIGHELEIAAFECLGGHNGIFVAEPDPESDYLGGERSVEIAAVWKGDMDDV